MHSIRRFVPLLLIRAFLVGQTIPSQNQFAGFKGHEEGHSLHRALINPAVAIIPGTSDEAYAVEASTGKLFRLNYATFRLTEINVSLKIEGGFVYSMAVDKEGVLYLPDPKSNRVLRIMPNGTATIFPAAGASLESPHATAIDPSGNVYIAEARFVRKVDPQGRISRFAGCSDPCAAGPLGINRSLSPIGLATDRRGNLYVTNRGTDPLWVMNPAGVVVAIRQTQDPARPGVPEKFADQARGSFAGLQVSPDGSIYVADSLRHVVWKVGPNGYWSIAVGRAIVAIDRRGDEDIPGDYYGNGPLTGKEHFSAPISIALDSAGRLLISDTGNFAIRLFTPNESLVTVAGQRRCCYREELIPANEATIEWPRGLAADAEGNVYVADPRSGRVRKIDRFGVISTVLGNGGLDARVGVEGTETGAQPYGVALDSKGNLYVAEPGLRMVRRVTPGGFVESVAGPQSGTFPIAPLNPGSEAVAVGPDDAVYYLADCSVNRWFAGRTEVAVPNACIFVGATARDEKPVVLAVGRDGTIYVATGEYQRIRAYRNGLFQTLPDVFPFGNLAFPYALHYGKDDLLYVTDAFGGVGRTTGTYYLAYALTAGARQLPISYTYSLVEFKEVAPGILESVGTIRKTEPFATTSLMGITTDSAGRVVVGQRSPPGLLIYPKVQGGN